ncbi:hypothetical protein FSP39_008806 [Pinctada imbricata]|uniref:Glutathione transferase n=1 Tax=Pinctada imbricata TaxID=66713 RepID=A0AA88Y2W3_PINIB|nr:hypothetical protein FSP39_008806 [Pinctada imbricata]
MYYEGSRDFQDLYLPIGFQDEKTVLEKAKAMSLSRYLPVFNQRLTSNNTGYLVGDTFTLADIGLLEPLLSAVEYFGLEILNDFPALKFTEVLLEQREEYLKLKEADKFVFDQVPMLEIDGKQLVQTGAMTRYIARKAGIYGSNDEEKVMIDMYYEGSRDFQGLYMAIGFQDEKTVLEKAKNFSTSRYLPKFNKRLTSNGTGFLVGSSFSLADLGLLEPLLSTVEYFGLEILNEYPALKSFYEAVTKRPSISKYLSGPQRKRKNDEKYIKTVIGVLQG